MDPAILASLNQIHSSNLREREGALRSLINKTLQGTKTNNLNNIFIVN